MTENQKTTDKKSFILYSDYKQHIDILTQEQKGDLLDCIFQYASGIDPECDGIVKMAFSFIKSQIDRDNDKYNKFIEKQRENGKKGGRPRKNPEVKPKNPKNPTLSGKTQKSLTDNDTDNDTDNVIIKKGTKVPSKKGERFNFVIHVNDRWYAEAKRIKPEFQDHDIQDEMERFNDYWIGVAGAKGLKLDWLATWRNWLKNSNRSVKSQYSKTKKPNYHNPASGNEPF